MRNTGKIIACEKDKKRFELLKNNTQKMGCANIECFLHDFLQIDPNHEDWKDIEYALVDPSCSGSGIVNRVESAVKQKDPARIEQLAKFQKTIVSHALKCKTSFLLI